MNRIDYLNDKFRRCPSFPQWNEATRLFIADNNKTPALREPMETLSVRLSLEWNARAYIAGPKGQLP